MKKLIYLLIVLPFLFSTSSCTAELDELWKNPNVYVPQPDEIVSGMLTPMQKTRFWMEDYGEWYWLSAYGSFGEVTQLMTRWPLDEGTINHFVTRKYGDLDLYMSTSNNNTNGRYSNFYTNLTNYMLIRDEISTLEGEGYDNSVIYLRLATILKNVVALQTVDLFNKIPYFSAFKGTQGALFGEYDDPLEIYKSVIEEYQAIAAELPALYSKMSSLSKNTLATQDIWFNGNIEQWVQYINSQILRSCIRMSAIDAEFVKPYIAKAIQNLPQNDQTFTSPEVNENRPSGSSGGIIQRGYYERYYNLAIPDVIMTRMNRGTDKFEPNIDDPRLPVIALGFTPDSTATNVEYYGTSMNWERNRYLRITLKLGEGRKWNVIPQNNPSDYVYYPQYNMDDMTTTCPWSFYNPITFVLAETPLTLSTMAEADLFLAEVALKGLASTGKTAGEHIKDAVIHSTAYWYMLNHAPNYADAMSDFAKAIVLPETPNPAVVEAYANTIQSEFNAAAGLEDKMEILMQQKYIHLNYMHGYEAFAELRRTRHPKLEPITSIYSGESLDNKTMMLERYTLPTSERSTNNEAYMKVAAEDKWGTPIFWVPMDKRSETYFAPQAIKAPLP